MSADPVPTIEVVAGNPTAEELAAVLVVLSALSAGAAEPVEAPTRSRWSAPARRLRTAYGPSRGGWRASALPH